MHLSFKRLYIVPFLVILTCGTNLHCKQAQPSVLEGKQIPDVSPLRIQSAIFLDQKVEETSGLIYFDHSFWTINDSGNPNILYRIDAKTGLVVSEVIIEGSENVDWEDMTQDLDHIYIGDIGDNAAVRDEKQVYKVKKSDLLNVNRGKSVPSEIIRFSYPQAEGKESRFDAEALISFKGSLHIFTKDLFETNHFTIPIVPGTAIAAYVGKFKTEGQVTGAAVDSATNTLLLVGYFGFGQRLFWEFKDIDKGSILTGTVRFFNLGPVTETGQLEAVCFTPERKVFLSNENFGGLKQQLWNLPYPIQ